MQQLILHTIQKNRQNTKDSSGEKTTEIEITFNCTVNKIWGYKKISLEINWLLLW